MDAPTCACGCGRPMRWENDASRGGRWRCPEVLERRAERRNAKLRAARRREQARRRLAKAAQGTRSRRVWVVPPGELPRRGQSWSHRQRMSESCRQTWADTELRAKLSERCRELWADSERRAALSEQQAALWTPERRVAASLAAGGDGRPGGRSKKRRHARIRAEGYEHFRAEDIYERDGWVCQLCGLPTERDAVAPHGCEANCGGVHTESLLAPTIDHVLPLARGGAHRADNVQCAHYICNVHKSDSEVTTQPCAV